MVVGVLDDSTFPTPHLLLMSAVLKKRYDDSEERERGVEGGGRGGRREGEGMGEGRV